MALNFPNNPTTGQEHTGVNNIVYRYDGEKWITLGSANVAGSDPTFTTVTTTGDATFGGDATIGKASSDPTTARGVRIKDAGSFNYLISNDVQSGGGVATVYQHLLNGAQTLALNGDGSASFAGNVFIGDDCNISGSDGSANFAGGDIQFFNDGAAIFNGAVNVYRNTGTNAGLIVGLSGVNKTILRAEGSGSFASYINCNRFSPNQIFVGDSTNGKQYAFYSTAGDGSTVNVGLGLDGSAEFARDVSVQNGNQLRAYRPDNTRYGSFYTTNTATILESNQSPADPLRLSSNARIEFYLNSVEQMRLDNSGRFTFYNSDVYNTVIRSSLAASRDNAFLGCTSNNTNIDGAGDGTIRFQIFTNGDAENVNGVFAAISDATLKENIVPATSQWDDIKGIEVVNYNFKEETGHETHKQLGVIAQQVEEVSPGLVNTKTDGLKSVNYSVLYMKSVKALQEAITRIETLEAEVAALKGV